MTILSRNQVLFSALGMVLLASPASAFCRATTCLSDPEAVCSWDDNGCIFEGVPLGWPLGATVSIELDTRSVDEATAQHLDESLRAAASTWLSVHCDAGQSLGLGGALGAGGAGGAEGAPDTSAIGGSAPNLRVQFVTKKGKVVIRPIADQWPYDPSVMAKSTQEFGLESGALEGATLLLNLVDYNFTAQPSLSTAVAVDSQAVLTHELGHVFGFDHTLVHGATMEAETTSAYSSQLRSLERDDGDAICALYPPLQSTEPEDIDLSDQVIPARSDASCQVTSRPLPRSTGAGLAWSLFGLAALLLNRARVRSIRQS